MQYIFLKFGLCHIVVLYDGTPFKVAFITMFEALNLNRDILAKLNHKGLTVEYFHHFFNKSITIATEERSINDIFVPVGVAASYTLNSTLIDGTNILRSIQVIVGNFTFPSILVLMLY